MSDLQKAQEMLAAAVAAREAEDPEITSVRQLVKLLEKASKNVRTFGPTNPVSQRFFDRFFEALTTHLDTYVSVSFLVQRSELYFHDVSVYGSAVDPSTENLAFKLYADGIRELTFHEGMSREDLAFFLDALWGNADPAANDDDDIVTRLWEKNLPTVSVVTADEAIKLSEAETALTPQEQETLTAQPSSLHAVTRQELAKPAGEGSKLGRSQTSSAGYDITPSEAEHLIRELEEESRRDATLYILDMLTAILASEQSPALLDRLITTFDGLIESVMKHGRWAVLESILLLLSDISSIRPDLNDEQTRRFRALVDTVGSQDRLRLIEQYLNKTERPDTSGLDSIFRLMPQSSVPAMCAMLGNLANPSHQAMVADLLVVIARDQPDPVLRMLSDRRSTLVRNALGILGKWANPRHADAVEKILRYPDPAVRREAIKTLGVLRPNGNGAKLIALLNDSDEGVRLAAFRLLLSENYTAPYSVWEPIMTAEDFSERPPAEKRNLFHAMRCTAGDDAVPFLTGLLTDRGWTNRRKREELALLAADALGRLATPAAVAALEVGRQKGGSTVKQACTNALAAAAKRAQVPKPSPGAC